MRLPWQAARLGCGTGSRLSPHLENCCLRLSANVAYESASKEISCEQDRREILDWYHLNENLQKVGGSIKRLKQAETYLWQGNVPSAIALFTKLKKKSAINFCKYLEKHQERIINYEVFQRDGICSIGSGAVESGINQIARRIKISGASWKSEHGGQVLAHRCAYLNGLIGKSRKAA